MLLRIANPKTLYPFVVSFILSYTFGFFVINKVWLSNTANCVESTLLTTVSDESATKTLELIVLEPEIKVKELDVTDYRKFPKPTGDGSYEHFKDLFEQVANTTGISSELLFRFASLESSFQSKASPGGASTAKGLFQFTNDTWAESVAKFGSRYGIDETTSVWDTRANTLMAAMRLRDAQKLLENAFPEREITETDLYLTHFLGRTGAIRFLKAKPTEIAARKMPAAARRNKNIFYVDMRPLTHEEVYLSLNARFDLKAKEFGLNNS